MYIIVVYDITENDVRAKVADILRAYGLARIQRSAYVGRLPPALVKELAERLARAVKGANADIAIFKVDKRAIETALRIPPRPPAGHAALH
ncbi:CRISPR-associated endonuclease Cas2 [Pyrobaculum neutrophilum]|uniref:CRISPR-associated endoribonuclease Cas2 n=1 Tax=Pyrobaculum neutrophilum (strain DSM 2338 / JCM 9278 / NBRC 100436 / V24Sta) TaxID=444157 RepID=B1YE58_PYRNV|nr:CRISPR-associated endonuclease Cas2 [Pyrobaculum neutrophilum]ACB40071.1 CRISPR-associated protein Cas2 [Pyrobaculum neutrophilum V24Sta]